MAFFLLCSAKFGVFTFSCALVEVRSLEMAFPVCFLQVMKDPHLSFDHGIMFQRFIKNTYDLPKSTSH